MAEGNENIESLIRHAHQEHEQASAEEEANRRRVLERRQVLWPRITMVLRREAYQAAQELKSLGYQPSAEMLVKKHSSVAQYWLGRQHGLDPQSLAKSEWTVKFWPVAERSVSSLESGPFGSNEHRTATSGICLDSYGSLFVYRAFSSLSLNEPSHKPLIVCEATDKQLVPQNEAIDPDVEDFNSQPLITAWRQRLVDLANPATPQSQEYWEIARRRQQPF